MKIQTVIKTQISEIIEYYNECWLNRFYEGHNPLSLAMHMGYFDQSSLDNDQAKINTNKFLTQYITIPVDTPIAIADLGCGVGGTCLYLAQNFPQAKITGVNISADQIDFANTIRRKNNKEKNLHYQLADYTDTGLPEAGFDFVIGIESICHAHDKINVYKEAYRLLKPGGCFAFMDYFETGRPTSLLHEDLLNDFRKGWAVDNYVNNAQTDLSQIGFKSIKEESIVSKVQPGIERSYHKAKQGVNAAELDAEPIFLNHLKACIALKKLVDDSLIDYKIVSARK